VQPEQPRLKPHEVTVVRQPLADIYIVESFKKFNYENTDHHHIERMRDGAGNGIGMALVQRAQDLAEEKCTVF